VSRILITLAAAALVLGLARAAPAAVQESDHARPMQYAEATWASFAAMVDTSSGLPTDQLHDDGTTDVQTSTTNIGAYLWSAAARRLRRTPRGVRDLPGVLAFCVSTARLLVATPAKQTARSEQR
jgi:hypothetical protein